MHDNSMAIMKKFVEEYDVSKTSVVDIGSFDVNGNYRGFFKGKYTGVDIQPGPNVDVIMDSEEWANMKDVDLVISGQTLEHVADIPKLMASIFNVLKPGGLLCIIAPSQGERHDYPIWVGNFSIERMTEAVEGAGLEVISCTLSDVAPFYDNCCVARKPEAKAKVTASRKGENEGNETQYN